MQIRANIVFQRFYKQLHVDQDRCILFLIPKNAANRQCSCMSEKRVGISELCLAAHLKVCTSVADLIDVWQRAAIVLRPGLC